MRPAIVFAPIVSDVNCKSVIMSFLFGEQPSNYEISGCYISPLHKAY